MTVRPAAVTSAMALVLLVGGCAAATSSPPGDGVIEGGELANEGEGEGGLDGTPVKPNDDPGVGGGAGGGDAGGGAEGGGQAGGPDPAPQAPCEYRDDGLLVCGPDWLIVNLADGGTVREAALPPGSVAVVRGAAGVDDRAHRFVRLGKPVGIDPAKDEAAGLAMLLWADAFASVAGEDGGAEVIEGRSDDGTRLSWEAIGQDVRYGVMYVLRGGAATAKTLIPPRTGGLGVDVEGIAADRSVSLPIRPTPELLVVQWAGTKALLCPGLEIGPLDTIDGLLADERFAQDHKLLVVLDLLDAIGAVLKAAAPAESWSCIRDHLADAIAPTVGAVGPQDIAAEDLIVTVAGVLVGSLGQQDGATCLGEGATLLPALAVDALAGLGGVTEVDPGQVEGLPAGACEHSAVAGFRAELPLPFDALDCADSEECDNGFDDDCSGGADDDERCGCDADKYEGYCDGDDLRERNGCGETRAVRACDHGCDDGECGGCVDPTYDPYCDFGTDELWEDNDCGAERFVRECEFGCELGACQACRDPSYDPYCDQDAVWERNDCGDERRVRDCEFGCDDGVCGNCADPSYDRFCHDGDGDVWERNDCGDERGIVSCACGCSGGQGGVRVDCNALACDPTATRCEDDVQQTCVGGCGWAAPANCACGCAGEGVGRTCAGVPANDGTTEFDQEGNDDAITRRQDNTWVINGAGRVGAEVWSDGYDPVIVVTGYALEDDDDWYYLVVDDGPLGSLQPRIILEPPDGTDLDLRVAYLNNDDREFAPNCDTGRACQGVAGHAGCCSTFGAGLDDEVRFNAETGLGDENSGVLLIRVDAFRTLNICDFYTLFIWI